MAYKETIIPEKIFFKIGEVCDLVEVQAHVLRYWETEFPMLSPKKNKSGQRTYRRKDVETALRIKDLLYEDLFTIAGAKKRLQAEMRGGVSKESVEESAVQNTDESGPMQRGLFGDDAETGVGLEHKSESGEQFELAEDKREALKTLASQLLELRALLSPKNPQDSEHSLSSSKPI
ncbi:MAG: MerR family transcriptional regulator [Pyrinomonadaceae bacterium]